MSKKKTKVEQDEPQQEEEQPSSGGSIAVNDAWTGMLAISFLALSIGAGFLYYDYTQYEGMDPPKRSPLTTTPPGTPKKIDEPKDGGPPKDGVKDKDGGAKDKDGGAKDKDAEKDKKDVRLDLPFRPAAPDIRLATQNRYAVNSLEAIRYRFRSASGM